MQSCGFRHFGPLFVRSTISLINMKKSPLNTRHINLALFFLLVMISCKIASVDYAFGQVKLTNKTKSTIAGKPAISLLIKNEGEQKVWNVLVTVKAKRKQTDISVQTIELDRLDSLETVERTVIFENLNAHDDYDLLTYAVAFSDSAE